MQKSVMTLSLLLSIYAPTHAMDLSVIHKCTADLAEIEKSEDPAALAREKYLTAQSLGCKNYNLLHAAVIAKKHNLITPLANAGFNTGSDAQCKYLLDYAIENNDLQSIDALLQHKKNIVIMDGSYSTSGCLLSAQTRIQPGTLMHLCKQIPNDTDFLRLKINCGKCIISTLSNDIKTLNECYEKGYLDSMLNDDDFSFDFQNWNLPADTKIQANPDLYKKFLSYSARAFAKTFHESDFNRLHNALGKAPSAIEYTDDIWQAHAKIERYDYYTSNRALFRKYAPIDNVFTEKTPSLIQDLKQKSNFKQDLRTLAAILFILSKMRPDMEIPEETANDIYPFSDDFPAVYASELSIWKWTSNGRNWYKPNYWISKHLNNTPSSSAGYAKVATELNEKTKDA